MGRGKKKSTRCKTSKKEHKHVDKSRQKALRSPASNKYAVPLNKIIDQNGKSAKYIHSKLIKQNKRSSPRTPRLSASAKLKIDEFIFGTPSKQKRSKKQSDVSIEDSDSNSQKISSNHNGSNSKGEEVKYDDDSKDIAADANMDENEFDPKFDLLTIKNLDKRVNEKIIQKIVNRKLSQNEEDDSALHAQISLKCVSILSVGTSKIAKIKLKKMNKDSKEKGLAPKIMALLNGKKLFGNELKCEIVSK